MIYLSQPLQKRVIPIFHYALKPTGFLMIGNTEGLLGAGSELFEMADKKQKIYRKRLVSTPVTFGFSVGQPEPGAGGIEAPAPPPKAPDAPKPSLELQREADRLLLGRYAPPAVVVNDQLEIIQSRGRTGTYLELPTGKASLHLLKMARPGLLFKLQSAIEEARKTGVEARREKVFDIEGTENAPATTIRVIPFKTPIDDDHSLLIVFEPERPEREAAGHSLFRRHSPTRRDRTRTSSSHNYNRSWPRQKNICRPSSRRRKLQTRSCSRQTKRSNPATKSCRAPTKSCRPRRKNWNRRTKSCIR